MKENINNTIKTPWFIRLCTKLHSLNIIILTIIIPVMGMVAGVCAYEYFKLQPLVPYEDFYDITFYTYANEELENVIHEITDEDSGINLEKIPENVSDFDLYYTNKGIKIYYSLDNNKIISQYNSETGKSTVKHSFEEDLRMSILMSNEFECIEKTSLIDEIPSQEEYQAQHQQNIKGDAIMLALLFSLLMILVWPFFDFSLLILSNWEKSHEKAEE